MKVTRRQCIMGITALGAGVGRAAESSTLSVLSFNILAGGTARGSLGRCAELIKKSGADIVGLQEVGGSGSALSDLTGYNRFERGSTQILSRFPLGDTSPRRLGVKVDVPGHGGIWVFNIHFRPAPYQPYQIAEIPYGKDNPFIKTEAEAISEAKRARGDQVEQLLAEMAPALSSGLPVLLTGDFNEPSHLDWTKRAAEGGHCALPVRWPASDRVCAAGLKDLYREAFPNEIARRGHTWTPVPDDRDVHDRIDFIYGKGIRTESAAVVGESEEKADIVVDPYPSDHRAVLARIRIG